MHELHWSQRTSHNRELYRLVAITPTARSPTNITIRRMGRLDRPAFWRARLYLPGAGQAPWGTHVTLAEASDLADLRATVVAMVRLGLCGPGEDTGAGLIFSPPTMED